MSLPNYEAIQSPNLIRGIMKPLQGAGVEFQISGGQLVPVIPDGVIINPAQLQSLTEYVNQVSKELASVNASSAETIAGTLDRFLQNPDPHYVDDLIMHGPSKENDFGKERMKRLDTVRQAVTEAQNAAGPGPDKVGTIQAAKFARTHLPDLGLKATSNLIKAFGSRTN